MFGANNQTYLTSFINWTDDVGPVNHAPTFATTNPPLACGFAPAVARCQEVGIIHAKANTAITLEVSQLSLSSGGSYNAYVVLESLKKSEGRADW